jgi:hypothetical protein
MEDILSSEIILRSLDIDESLLQNEEKKQIVSFLMKSSRGLMDLMQNNNSDNKIHVRVAKTFLEKAGDALNNTSS